MGPNTIEQWCYSISNAFKFKLGRNFAHQAYHIIVLPRVSKIN